MKENFNFPTASNATEAKPAKQEKELTPDQQLEKEAEKISLDMNKEGMTGEIDRLKAKIDGINEAEQKNGGVKITDRRGGMEVVENDRNSEVAGIENDIRQLEGDLRNIENIKKMTDIREEIKNLEAEAAQKYAGKGYIDKTRPGYDQLIAEKEEELRMIEKLVKGEKENPEEKKAQEGAEKDGVEEGEEKKSEDEQEKQPEKILQITDERLRDKEANIVPVDKNREEREQNLLKLEKELENSRLDLAKMDLKKGKLWQRVAGFFKKDAGQLGEDKDVAFMRERYENSLKSYKSAFLEEAKRGNITEDEVGYILEYFDADEKAKLYDTRTEARLENAKGTKLEFIRENCAKAVNWYIELKPPKKKLALGVALGAGAGAAAIAASFGVAGAGTVAGALAAANMLKRVLGGAAFGVTADAYLDKKGEARRARKSDEKVESFKDEVKELSAAEKIDRLNELLENNASEVSKDLQKRKVESLLQKSGSAFAGYLVGSGALFRGIMHSADFISDKTGLGEYIKDSDAGKWVTENSKWVMDKLHLGGVIGDQAAPEGAEALSSDGAEALNPEAAVEAGPANLIVEKGSSLEGSIIQHLKANPDLLEKYNELHGGGRTFDAGAAAHRMALEFAEKNAAEFPDGPPSLIHPGAAIDIDTEHMSIADVKDAQGLGYLPETPASAEVPPTETPSVEAPTEAPVEASPEAAVEAPVELSAAEKIANESRVVKGIGLSQEEYNQIKNLKVGELRQKLPSYKEVWAAVNAPDGNYPNLPHDGVYQMSELNRQIKLSEYLGEFKPDGAANEMTVEDFLKEHKPGTAILRAIGMNGGEYTAIQDVKVGEFLEKLPSGGKDFPNLPHDGVYGMAELNRQTELADYIRSHNLTPDQVKNMSVRDFLTGTEPAAGTGAVENIQGNAAEMAQASQAETVGAAQSAAEQVKGNAGKAFEDLNKEAANMESAGVAQETQPERFETPKNPYDADELVKEADKMEFVPDVSEESQKIGFRMSHDGLSRESLEKIILAKDGQDITGVTDKGMERSIKGISQEMRDGARWALGMKDQLEHESADIWIDEKGITRESLQELVNNPPKEGEVFELDLKNGGKMEVRGGEITNRIANVAMEKMETPQSSVEAPEITVEQPVAGNEQLTAEDMPGDQNVSKAEGWVDPETAQNLEKFGGAGIDPETQQIRNDLVGGDFEKWNAVKGMTYSEALEKHPEMAGALNEAQKNLIDEYGDTGRPGADESLDKWTGRTGLPIEESTQAPVDSPVETPSEAPQVEAPTEHPATETSSEAPAEQPSSEAPAEKTPAEEYTQKQTEGVFKPDSASKYPAQIQRTGEAYLNRGYTEESLEKITKATGNRPITVTNADGRSFRVIPDFNSKQAAGYALDKMHESAVEAPGVSEGIEKTVDSARGAGSPREIAEKIVSMQKDISGGSKVRWDQIKNFTSNDFDRLQPFERQHLEKIIAEKVQENGMSGRPMPGVMQGGQMTGGETLDQWARRVGVK